MTMPMVRFCEKCGHEPTEEARFCGGCGHVFPARPPDTPPAGPMERRADAMKAKEEALYDLRPLAVQTWFELVLVIVTFGLAWVFLWLRRAQTHYRITSQRIELGLGLVSITRQTVELFRVQDFEVREPFFLRLRGAGHLVVRSMDPGEPKIVLEAIPGARDVFEKLRGIVYGQREDKGVRLLEGI